MLMFINCFHCYSNKELAFVVDSGCNLYVNERTSTPTDIVHSSIPFGTTNSLTRNTSCMHVFTANHNVKLNLEYGCGPSRCLTSYQSLSLYANNGERGNFKLIFQTNFSELAGLETVSTTSIIHPNMTSAIAYLEFNRSSSIIVKIHACFCKCFSCIIMFVLYHCATVAK